MAMARNRNGEADQIHYALSTEEPMVDISLSGSGEGPGASQRPGLLDMPTHEQA